jgi:hypothetical protein
VRRRGDTTLKNAPVEYKCMWRRIGRALQIGGVALCVAYFLVTAATAPPLHAGEESPEVLVGAMGAGWDGTVTQYDADGIVWRHTTRGSHNDVQRINESAVLATVTVPKGDCGRFADCDHTGVQILRTGGDRPRVAWEWTFPVKTARNSEVHDAELLPDGDVVLADMDRERLLRVDRETEEIVWEWHASEFYDPPAEPLDRDWLHINDIDRLGPGRYLVSVRNANQVLVVERGRGVVDVINRDDGGDDGSCQRGPWLADSDGDGDVRCGDPAVFANQHNPQWLGPGRVLVADSGNDRVVELREGADGNWSVVWTVERANGVALKWPRDADRLRSGQTVIADTWNRRVVSVRPNGSVAWSHDAPPRVYEADVGGREYPAGPPVSRSGTVTETTGQPLGLSETLYTAVRTQVGLPYWVSSWHVTVVLAGGVLVLAGTVLRRLAARREE